MLDARTRGSLCLTALHKLDHDREQVSVERSPRVWAHLPVSSIGYVVAEASTEEHTLTADNVKEVVFIEAQMILMLGFVILEIFMRWLAANSWSILLRGDVCRVISVRWRPHMAASAIPSGTKYLLLIEPQM